MQDFQKSNESSAVTIDPQPRFTHGQIEEIIETSLNELTVRWQQARRAAFPESLRQFGSESEILFELKNLRPEDFEEVLKKVFLNSRNLGMSYVKRHRLVWDLTDVKKNFSRLGSPCLQGDWELRLQNDQANVAVLRRDGCASGASHGAHACQYWREAIDGLVMGLCESERFARHESVTSGDSSCVDVFYVDEVTPTDSLWQNPHRWGPIADDMKGPLKEIEESFARMKVQLQFLGISENQLFYKLEAKENQTCGTTGDIYRTHLTQSLHKVFPHLQLKDASPLAVYGEKA